VRDAISGRWFRGHYAAAAQQTDESVTWIFRAEVTTA
jgi:hypothetical protein